MRNRAGLVLADFHGGEGEGGRKVKALLIFLSYGEKCWGACSKFFGMNLPEISSCLFS